jgi:hypothetical protein
MTHRVYLSFFVRGAGEWVVQFSPPSLDLIDRTPTRFDLAERNAHDYAFRTGRGGIWLQLTPEQFRAIQ